jgi:hypothetical protein
MSEDLISLSNINRVLSNFDSKTEDLRLIYPNDANFDLKITLLRVWLEVALFFYLSYGIKGIEAYLKSRTHSFLCFAENLDGNKYKCECYYESSMSKSLFALFVIKFLDLLYLRGHPASVSFTGKVKKVLLRRLPFLLQPKKSISKQLQIINFLNDCCDFEGIDILFQKKVPAVFFSHQFGTTINKKITIIGASAALYDFDGYENLLLINRKIDFIGMQHGGGYNLYSDDFFYRSEFALSSTFYGLGTEVVNISPYRYNNISLTKGLRTNIFWVERPKLAFMSKYTLPEMYTFEEGVEGINYIDLELDSHIDIAFRLPYANRRSDQYDFVNTKIHKDINLPEKIIDSKSIVVFDQITHTLIYFCIQFNISFIVVLKREIKKLLTPNGLELLNSLYERKSLVYSDEPGELVRLINTKIDEFEN